MSVDLRNPMQNLNASLLKSEFVNPSEHEWKMILNLNANTLNPVNFFEFELQTLLNMVELLFMS